MIDYLQPHFADLPGRRQVPALYARQPLLQGIQPDVSILTPYYNTEAFFAETFVCLQAQSLQNWEWIIVDDGSTDQASVDRLKQVAESDSRITVIHQDNAGPSAARNTAYRHAKGRYVCLLDSDDMVEHTYFDKTVWFLESNTEFAFCNSYSVVFGDQEYLWTNGFERGAAHLHSNSGPPISMIRHAAYDACGGFDESIRFGHEDWDFWLAMAKTGHWGYTIKEYLQWYRKRGNGRFEQIMRSGDVNDKFEALIRQKYVGLEARFPVPARSHPAPYEHVPVDCPVRNPLQPNASGRRVMFLLPWMVTGGADRVNLDLIEGLVSRGHQVTICASLNADHRWEHQFSRFTPDIFSLPNFLRPADYARFLAYLIESRQIDTVLITASTLGYQVLPYLRAVFTEVAFMDMCHVEEPHWQNGGHPRFAIGYQDQLDLNIVTTQHLSDWMQGRGAEAERMRVMYTGIRTTTAQDHALLEASVRQQYTIAAGVPIIVFAGRLCAQKRPELLAEILHNVQLRGPAFHALIIGDGELRPDFEKLLDEYQLRERVTMLGSVPHQQWLDILVAADILLMPSQYEGISIALLESLASGVVPVVARVGGQAEIVPQSAGFLIAHGSEELGEYTDAVVGLVTDTEKLQRMSAESVAVANSKLSWTGMIDQFEALMLEAHALRVGQPRHLVSPAFGREMVTMALENKRLGEAVDWLWNIKDRSASGAQQDPLASAAEVQAITRFAVVLSQTRLGRWLIRSTVVKNLARWMLRVLSH